jgi:S1-C subfamily serine protease
LRYSQVQVAQLKTELLETQSTLQRANSNLTNLRGRIDSLGTPQALFDRLQSVSVLVDVGRGCGTGVLVTRKVGNVSKTYVWTAGHVVAVLKQADGTFGTATIVQEKRTNGLLTGKKTVEARVIAYSDADRGEDLAILEIVEDNFTSASADFYDEQILPVGTELIHVGCTLSLYNSVSRGIISQTDRDLLETGKVFDQTSCMGYPGSSGGGVYLAKGGVCVGLLVRGAGPGLNFIVPTRRMLSWSKEVGVEWALNPSIPVPLTRAPTKLEEPAQDDRVETATPDGRAADKRIQKWN